MEDPIAAHLNTRRVLKRLASPALALLLVLASVLPTIAAAQDVAGTITRMRIGVVNDGITVVGPDDLARAGVDPTSIDPKTFALKSLGQSVAIYVSGEADGRFDPVDRLYFFGEKFRGPEMDQKYTDERVYWLDIGGTAGPRMAIVNAAPLGEGTAPADFGTTLRAEESMEWFALHTLTMDTEDTWYWARLAASTSPATARLSSDVPYPAPDKRATLRLEEISHKFGPWSVNPDHHTTAVLNGQLILNATWDGQYVQQVFTADIPAGLLHHGSNDLDVTALTAPGTYGDEVFANYWELDYRRQFRAWQDQLDFRAEVDGTQEYVATDFSGPEVWIWDVTNTGAPVRLTTSPAPGTGTLYLPLVSGGRAVELQNGSTVRFRVDSTVGNRYWLQSTRSLKPPASIRQRSPTNLRDPAGGADAVLVTSAELRLQAEGLAEWHRNHGRRALVVDIQDAYDEFNDGVYHPKAVQAMMKWAAANWEAPAPAYLTLFGDGHWNFKGYNPSKYPGGPIHIPPYLAFEDPWMGEAPVDGRYADLNDDKLPEIAVGRIAVNTSEEATTVVAKIQSYDEGLRLADWQRRAIFVADAPDLVAGDFETITEQIISGYTPADLIPTRVYRKSRAEPLAGVKAQLLAELNAGAFMVQYTGHGAIWSWADGLLTEAEIATLANGARLPVVLTFNCLDGNSAYAGAQGIAELMQRQAGGGSIAAISPSGLGLTSDQLVFRQILLTVIFNENVREIGKALTITIRRYSELGYGPNYLTQTMSLFGDPAMRLPERAP